jgi:DNA-binding IclR family transcriptional regulator
MPRYPTRAPASAADGGVAAVDKALALLTAFRERDGALTLTEIAERTHLVKSTVLRMLASLQHAGLVRRSDDGRAYTLGPEIARLYGIYVGSFSLHGTVLPALQRLVERTRESAAFHVRQGDRRVTLYRVDSLQPVRDHGRAGDVFPLDRGTGGRVLLAFSGAKGAVYDRIRRDKVAAIVGDRTPDLAGISAPVFRAGGEIAGAITLTMPAMRYNEKHIPVVKATAVELTRELGATYPD